MVKVGPLCIPPPLSVVAKGLDSVVDSGSLAKTFQTFSTTVSSKQVATEHTQSLLFWGC